MITVKEQQEVTHMSEVFLTCDQNGCGRGWLIVPSLITFG